MDFFEENDNKNSDENSYTVINDEPDNGYQMPDGAVNADEKVGIDFWEGITLPQTGVKKKAKKRWGLTVLLSLLLVAAGFGIAVVSVRGQGVLENIVTGDKHINFTLPVSDKPEVSGSEIDDSGKYTAEGLAEAMSPSVVSIEVYSSEAAFTATGQGSGVVMTSDGYIATNAHVVDAGNQGIKVVLSSGAEFEAKVIGSDAQSDIAVIKIPATNLQPCEFGNSDDIKLGEEVVTIGSPAGYYGSVTKGIVSGLNRTIKLQNDAIAQNCIQIDAAINPGNSGGALFNMWGQVIGITSSKLESNDYEGIGFAISTNEAKPIIEQLMEKGKITDRVKIGISYYPISQATADIYGVVPGICVAKIDEECDVANTDLQIGDIITKIDGTDVSDYDDVSLIFEGKKSGDDITCHVFRMSENGEQSEFDISFTLMQDNGTFVEN